MKNTKAEILAQLQKEILPLQGFKPVAGFTGFDAGLGFIKTAFPNATFPLGAIHEFICSSPEDMSASCGFVSAIVSAIMQQGGVTLWIGPSIIFPPALKAFGIEPDKVIFVHLQKNKEILWAMEEALRCNGLAAVIAEPGVLGFTESRRLQLAVEQSRVTGFMLRRNPSNLATACVARWQVSPQPTAIDGLPGLGFPRWSVQLLKVRNGTPGQWQLEWAGGRFRHVHHHVAAMAGQQRKAV